jgi:hypothetical protein
MGLVMAKALIPGVRESMSRHQGPTLKIYGRLWLVWWTALGGLSLLLGAGRWPVLGLVGVFLTSGVAAGAIATLPVMGDADRRSSTVQLVWGVVLAGLQGGLGVTMILVSFSSMGRLTVPLLILILLTSPWTVRFSLRAALRPRPHTPSEQQRMLSPRLARTAQRASDWTAAVQALTDEELCASWRASYAMMRAASPEDWVELVTLRQAYLDDLERRNPGGMRAWLDSGARAASNPARYLATDHRGG